jgi:signal transduction histidine kinase/ActR/RegA family two-component response regulator
MKAPLPPNETLRIRTLREYDALDTPPEQSFDDLTLLASQICQTPMAAVSLVDEKRQWFKSKIGFQAAETSRDIAFCAHTILNIDRVLEVPDAKADTRFTDSLLVTSDPHIRFYAGAPLVSQNGQAVGALCVMDCKPHTLTKEQLAALRALSRHVVAQLELRKQSRALAKEVDERRRAEELLQNQCQELAAKKNETDSLLELGEKSRRALLSVLEDERRTSEELTSKTAFLEAQVESTLDGILVVNSQAKVILKNQQFLRIFKVPADLSGNEDDDKLRSWATSRIKSPEEFSKRVNELYADQNAIGRDEIALVDGAILDRYSAPVRDKDGKYYGRIWVFRDITERRNLETQLLQSQKMEGIGQLAGGVAHDFNNILGIIQMQAGLLKDGGNLSEKQSEFADEIGATVQRAAALTRQLLLFSRRETFQPRDMDLSELVTGTAKMLRRILREDVQIELKLASHSLLVHGDPGMVDQVLMNLTVNARDAMPTGGTLTIETSAAQFDNETLPQASGRRAGSFVCLRVTDTGSGIPPEILPKIFEPFFTTKEVGKGTGLGLATVFGIVQQHQGWVEVDSKVGRGTTFKVYFPRLAGMIVDKLTHPVLKEVRGGCETILLAEDDPSLRLSIRTALSELGYRILEAPTGAKAVDVWKENRDEIRLLLTDLIMPGGMTGKALARTLVLENPDLKVIYMSGYSQEISGEDFQLKEGVNFLAKPFLPARLAETIRNNLDKAHRTILETLSN